jgi:aspartate racemase
MVREDNKNKVIGILGGMGPEATMQLYQYILANTPADQDQDHISTIIYSLPQIPDRTKAILENGEDPVPLMIYGAKVLENAGADFILIACNTAHKFIKQVQPHLSIPILNMIEETFLSTKRQYPKCKKVGLLATSGTIKTRIYHNVFEPKGLQIIVPDEKMQQDCVMDAIYKIKKGQKNEAIKNSLDTAIIHLFEKGAEVVILGCTELPLIVSSENNILPIINPTEIIARAAINTTVRYFKEVAYIN